ncbi:MAG: glycosyl hydrolase [Kiritimatiellae bacterium]|nr:glycosyl hydrolase [Kiritimatiellia bacterium]
MKGWWQAVLLMGLLASQAVLGAGARMRPDMVFRSPPADARPLTWWHWLNGNITREGVTKDLEAMARIGLGGCYMFNCGGQWPTGQVRFLQPAWLDMVRHTLTEAERLGLKFGVHNCDGFSEAGGPWITPATSMKILVWSAAEVTGPGERELELAQPPARESFYREIAVVAFPVPEGQHLSAELAGTVPAAELRALQDGQPATQVVFPRRPEGHAIEWRFEAPRVVRSLRAANCAPHVWESDTPMVLEASTDGVGFRPVGVFTLNWDFQRSDDWATVALETATAVVIRIAFTNSVAMRIGELRLSDAARVHFAEAKAGRLRSRGHGAEWRHHRAYPGPALDRELPATHVVRPAEVLDLTRAMSAEGRLRWRVPDARRWRVLRIGFTSNGHYVGPATAEGRGLECDKLDARVVRFHLEQYVGRLLKLAGPAAGRTFAAMEIDSWECGIQNWTDGLERRFRERVGYELTPFWPALLEGWIVGSADESDRMLWDWRRFLADELDRNFFAVASQFAADHRLTFVAESTGRQQYLYNVGWHRRSHVPMGEFWLDRSPGGWLRVDNKVAASLAHITGRSVIAAEAYTAGPEAEKWQNHPYTLKELGDQAFCAGVNQFVFHTFAHQPWDVVGPGFTFFHWGLNFNRHNTWWEDGRPWIEYITRCQWMLRQGRFVADVLAFVGDDVPNRIGWREELSPPLPWGYDFDGADGRAVLEAGVRDGRIVLPSGMRYRVLLLPPIPTMRVAVAEQVRRLLEDGATVLAPVRPVRSPSLAERGDGDRRVERALGHLWADSEGEVDRPVGRGRLLSGMSFEEAFRRLGVAPDVQLGRAASDAEVRWIHRRVEDWNADVYFVCQSRERSESAELVFRDAAGEPELWDPMDGTVRAVGLYRRESDGRCRVPLVLPPRGSVFVVFRPSGRARYAVEVESAGWATRALPPSDAPVREADSDFTLSAWVWPGRDIPLPPERRALIAFEGQNWLVPPPHGERAWGRGHAGMGVAVGRNGVVVFEHSAHHAPAVLTWTGDLSGGAHVAVAVAGGVPALYVNGHEMRRATGTTMRVHARAGSAESFRGRAERVALYSRRLSDAEIAALAAPDDLLAGPAAELVRARDGSLWVRRWRSDPLRVRLNDGRETELSRSQVVHDFAVRGRWTITFPAGRGAPPSVALDELVDLSLHADPGVRHFSGTATYSIDFELPPGISESGDQELWLDLGAVHVIASVRLDGRELGTVWAPPFRLRLDPPPAPGRHRLEVRVTNLWVNRLIGDARFPDDDVRWVPSRAGERVPIEWPEWLLRGGARPSGRIAFLTRGGIYSAGALLAPSGLVGPVVVRTVAVDVIR